MISNFYGDKPISCGCCDEGNEKKMISDLSDKMPDDMMNKLSTDMVDDLSEEKMNVLSNQKRYDE